MPQLYVGVGSLAPSIHCRFHLVRAEDEHLTFSPTASDKSTFFFDEASFVVEMNLHALFHYLTNWDQILHYCQKLEHARHFWCRFGFLLPQMGHYWHVEWGELCHPQFPHNRVVRAFVVLKTNPHETSCGWMHPSRQTIHLLSWRCWSSWRLSLSLLYDSLQTLPNDRCGQNWSLSLWVVDLWRPTHSSFCDTLPRSGQTCHSIYIERNCSTGL